MRDPTHEGPGRRAVPARDRVLTELDTFGAPFAETVAGRTLHVPISSALEPGRIAAPRDAAYQRHGTVFLDVLEPVATDSETDARG